MERRMLMSAAGRPETIKRKKNAGILEHQNIAPLNR